jgi:hypothetical protein
MMGSSPPVAVCHFGSSMIPVPAWPHAGTNKDKAKSRLKKEKARRFAPDLIVRTLLHK